MTLSIKILVAIGFVLSAYAYQVAERHKKHKNYKPLCDISKDISCTKAFTSSSAALLGHANSLFGMLFYAAIYLLVVYSQPTYIFYASIGAVIGCVYLGYLQYQMKNFCVVCAVVYLINILLLWFSWQLVY
jgi:uncharacterized membrane protein